MRWSASGLSRAGQHVSIVWDSAVGGVTIVIDDNSAFGETTTAHMTREVFEPMMAAIGMWPIGKQLTSSDVAKLVEPFDAEPGYSDMHGTSECHRARGRASLCRAFGVPLVVGREAHVLGRCPGCGGEVIDPSTGRARQRTVYPPGRENDRQCGCGARSFEIKSDGPCQAWLRCCSCGARQPA